MCSGRSKGPRGEEVAGGDAGIGDGENRAEPLPLRADEADWGGGVHGHPRPRVPVFLVKTIPGRGDVGVQGLV